MILKQSWFKMNILNKAFLISFLLLTSHIQIAFEGMVMADEDVVMADADLMIEVPVVLNYFLNIEFVNLNNHMTYHDLKILISGAFGINEDDINQALLGDDILDLDSDDLLDIVKFQVNPQIFVF